MSDTDSDETWNPSSEDELPPRRLKRKRNVAKSAVDSDDESDLDELIASDSEDKNPKKSKRKKRKTDRNEIQSVFAQLAYDSLSGEVYKNARIGLRLKNWKTQMGRKMYKKHKSKLVKANEYIEYLPTIKEICELKASDDSISELIEMRQLMDKVPTETDSRKIIREEIKQKMELIKEKASPSRKPKQRVYNNLWNRIKDAPLSEKNRQVIETKYDKYKTMCNSNSDKDKLESWLEWAITISDKIKPLSVNKDSNNWEITNFLTTFQETLDNELYGMDKIKERVMMMVNRRINNPDAIGSSLALVGPAGCGKTHLAQAIAKGLDLPFAQISLGGATDSAFLDGHSYTYVGSMPGMIVQCLKNMKYKNGIIFLDEIDKLANYGGGEQVANLLLHVIDFTQNHTFVDKYLHDIEIDLSKITFIYSINDPAKINPILLSRIPQIRIDGYSKPEKLEIAKKHIIPKALKSCNIPINEVSFTDEALYRIMDISGNLPGIREYQAVIDEIIMKLLLMKKTSLSPAEAELDKIFSDMFSPDTDNIFKPKKIKTSFKQIPWITPMVINEQMLFNLDIQKPQDGAYICRCIYNWSLLRNPRDFYKHLTGVFKKKSEIYN